MTMTSGQPQEEGHTSRAGEHRRPTGETDARDALTAAAEQMRRSIGGGGAASWGAVGRSPAALVRRICLRVLRPYIQWRSQLDSASLTALNLAEVALQAQAQQAANTQDQAREGAFEEARRIEGGRALDLVAAATTRCDPLDAVVCTVVSRETIAHAHALARSVSRVHPGTTTVALITDQLAAADLVGAVFVPIPLEDVLGGSAAEWRANHKGVTLEYAVTPSLILHLLEAGHHRLVFIKQESMVVGSLQPVLDELGDASIGLTPHLLVPPTGADARERLQDVMLAGTFNGGVIAVNDTVESRRVMRWWESRLHDECAWDVVRGRHYEQRWLDLIPATFDDVAILRGPGLNVGHWNIADRQFTGGPGHLRANGEDIAVLRFSGFQPGEPDVVTRYAPDRLAEGLPPALDTHLRAFREELLAGTEQASA